MNKFTVTLPTKQHNKTSNAKHIKDIEQVISIVAGGYTSVKANGGWFDSASGRMYRDASVLVSTYCSDTQLEELLRAVPTWGQALQQIEMLVEVLRERNIYVAELRTTIALHELEVHFIEGTREQDFASVAD